MTEGFWWQLLLAFGYGVFGSIVPVVNGEALIVAALATGLIGPVAVGLGLGLGQGLGKAILFQAVRQGRRLPFISSRAARPDRPAPQPGTWRFRWSRLLAWGVRLVEHHRWGPIGVFLSGSLSLPPNYATTLLAATTRINFVVFAIFMTAGFTARYIVLALLLSGVLDQLIS